jgi:hypothetical protein
LAALVAAAANCACAMETMMYAALRPIRDLARFWLRADFLLLCGARSVTASLAAEPAE